MGFLRINDGENPLDKTPIHPESYGVVKKLLQHMGFSLKDVGISTLRAELAKINIKEMAPILNTGIPTLKDIVEALMRPGRDPREELPKPILRTDVLSIEHLQPGMELKGTVRNVVDFGAFVDLGVQVDGLIHISQMSDRYIKHPLEAVSVGDVVDVRVLEVDQKRQRIALSLKRHN